MTFLSLVWSSGWYSGSCLNWASKFTSSRTLDLWIGNQLHTKKTNRIKQLYNPVKENKTFYVDNLSAISAKCKKLNGVNFFPPSLFCFHLKLLMQLEFGVNIHKWMKHAIKTKTTTDGIEGFQHPTYTWQGRFIKLAITNMSITNTKIWWQICQPNAMTLAAYNRYFNLFWL